MAMILLDIFRLIPMASLLIFYFGAGRRADMFDLASQYSMVHFLSWVSLIKYMRRVPGVRGYIPLLEAALTSLTYFLSVILLFMMAFGSALRTMHQVKQQAVDSERILD